MKINLLKDRAVPPSVKPYSPGILPDLIPYLTRRLAIPAEFSQGTFFSRSGSAAYFDALHIQHADGGQWTERGPKNISRHLQALVAPETRHPFIRWIEPQVKPMAEIARILINECANRNSAAAATLYIESMPKEVAGIMFARGFTFIDLLRMTEPEFASVVRFAREKKVSLDYHAPWLSRVSDRGVIYPTPGSHPDIFFALQKLAETHYKIMKTKPQVTVHMAGDPKDWMNWTRLVGRCGSVLVENAFLPPDPGLMEKMRALDEKGFFLHSEFVSPAELIGWMAKLGTSDVCFDQAHAFGGYRLANGGIFDPVGDLKYLKILLDAGLVIKRIHRAAVPRMLAGETRGARMLDQLDDHGPVTPFTRRWFKECFPAEGKLIDEVFDGLRALNEKWPIAVTFEVIPKRVENFPPSVFETDFS
ncbi:MAG TPA: hypothetical protein VMD02_06980 [Candidatus Omnitrophota bacterium]|nr:hypothetical protein [Candidatus Omnitrophota bacterium]